MLEMPQFTARNVAKHVVTAIIAGRSTEIAKNLAEDYTRFEKDDLVVKIGAGVIGWGVADKVKPYSDKMVDKTADFIAAKRATRAAKKEKTTEK